GRGRSRFRAVLPRALRARLRAALSCHRPRRGSRGPRPGALPAALAAGAAPLGAARGGRLPLESGRPRRAERAAGRPPPPRPRRATISRSVPGVGARETGSSLTPADRTSSPPASKSFRFPGHLLPVTTAPVAVLYR